MNFDESAVDLVREVLVEMITPEAAERKGDWNIFDFADNHGRAA